MSAPMRSRVRTNPMRAGFSDTFWMVMELPGFSRAAAATKAAEEGSPGTTTSEASISAGPVTVATRVPAVVGTLNSGSMSSVWLREGAGSFTVVVPSAKTPARSTAVFS